MTLYRCDRLHASISDKQCNVNFNSGHISCVGCPGLGDAVVIGETDMATRECVSCHRTLQIRRDGMCNRCIERIERGVDPVTGEKSAALMTVAVVNSGSVSPELIEDMEPGYVEFVPIGCSDCGFPLDSEGLCGCGEASDSRKADIDEYGPDYDCPHCGGTLGSDYICISCGLSWKPPKPPVHAPFINPLLVIDNRYRVVFPDDLAKRLRSQGVQHQHIIELVELGLDGHIEHRH